MRSHVFISYSHKDKRWLEQLQTMLKPLVRSGELKIWDDTQIRPGSNWRDAIKQALATAKVAVLLVTPDFLASDFIATDELPPLLQAAKNEGLTILWISVRKSLVDKTKIGVYQAVGNPAKPLSGLSRAAREGALVRICEEIIAAVEQEPPNLPPSPAEPSPPDKSRENSTRSFESKRRLQGNLPPARDSFIGRKRELEQGATYVEGSPLTTLKGEGGIGKSRLATELGRKLLSDYPHKVWSVDLARVKTPDLIPEAIARELGLSGTANYPVEQTLIDYLRDKQLLLVLDNCDLLLKASADLAMRLFNDCPEVKIIATSREVLRVQGEQPWKIKPLGEREAIDLFVARVQKNVPTFALSPQNADDINQICVQLERLPLAIELAAGWIPTCSVRGLREMLKDQLAVLTDGPVDADGRHETARAMIEWSYKSLQPAEQFLFERLGVFVGGFTDKAAEAICSSPGETSLSLLKRLRSFLEKSLLRVEDGLNNEQRFMMGTLIRQYAHEQLQLRGESENLRRRHAAYYLAQVAGANQDLVGPNQASALARLTAEYPNVQAALDWSETPHGDPGLGLQLAGTLGEFWFIGGYWREGSQRLKTLLASAGNGLAAPRAKTLYALGLLAWCLDDHQLAIQSYEQGLALYEQANDKRGIAWTTLKLGEAERDQAQYAQAHTRYIASLTLFQQLKDQQGIASALESLGHVARDQGNLTEAEAQYQASLKLFKEINDTRGIAWALHDLGNVARHGKQYEQALAYYAQCLPLLEAVKDRRGIAWTTHNQAGIARETGDYGQANPLYEQSAAILREIGDKRGLGWVLGEMGDAAREQGQRLEAQRQYQASLDIFTELDDQRGRAWTIKSLADLAQTEGNDKQAGETYLQALEIFGKINDQRGMAWSFGELGALALKQRDYARAEAQYIQSLDLFNELQDTPGAAQTLHNLGGVARAAQDFVEAQHHFAAGLALFKQLGDQRNIAWALFELGNVARLQKNYGQAWTRYAEARGVFQTLGEERAVGWIDDFMAGMPPNEQTEAPAQPLLERER